LTEKCGDHTFAMTGFAAYSVHGPSSESAYMSEMPPGFSWGA